MEATVVIYEVIYERLREELRTTEKQQPNERSERGELERRFLERWAVLNSLKYARSWLGDALESAAHVQWLADGAHSNALRSFTLAPLKMVSALFFAQLWVNSSQYRKTNQWEHSWYI